VLYRAILNDSLAAVASGGDPFGVIRDPAQHKLIDFGTQQHDAVRALSMTQTAAE
jgi:hypothetical protein